MDKTFQDQVSKFIESKADFLFNPGKKLSPITPSHNDGDLYAVLPPLETFLGIPGHLRKQHFYDCLQKGDIIIGIVSGVQDTGLIITLLCMDQGKARDIDQLKITAFCPLREIPKSYTHEDPLEHYDMKDKVRGTVLSVSPQKQLIVLSFQQRALLPHLQHIKLGLVSDEELPRHFRFLQEDDPLHYDEYLEKMIGFVNPNNVDTLSKMLGLSDQNLSLTKGLRNLVIDKDHYAEELRRKQSHRYALKSVVEGVSNFKQGKHVEAMQYLNKALQIDKENVEALVARGALYANNESYLKAIEDFEQALSLNPDHTNAKKYICETLVAHGRRLVEQDMAEEAIEYIERALKRDENILEAQVLLKLAEERTQQHSTPDSSHVTLSGDKNHDASSQKTGHVSQLMQTKEMLRRIIEEEKDDMSSKRGRNMEKGEGRQRSSSSSSSSSTSDSSSSSSSSDTSSSSSSSSQGSRSVRSSKQESRRDSREGKLPKSYRVRNPSQSWTEVSSAKVGCQSESSSHKRRSTENLLFRSKHGRYSSPRESGSRSKYYRDSGAAGRSERDLSDGRQRSGDRRRGDPSERSRGSFEESDAVHERSRRSEERDGFDDRARRRRSGEFGDRSERFRMDEKPNRNMRRKSDKRYGDVDYKSGRHKDKYRYSSDNRTEDLSREYKHTKSGSGKVDEKYEENRDGSWRMHSGTDYKSRRSCSARYEDNKERTAKSHGNSSSPDVGTSGGGRYDPSERSEVIIIPGSPQYSDGEIVQSERHGGISPSGAQRKKREHSRLTRAEKDTKVSRSEGCRMDRSLGRDHSKDKDRSHSSADELIDLTSNHKEDRHRSGKSQCKSVTTSERRQESGSSPLSYSWSDNNRITSNDNKISKHKDVGSSQVTSGGHHENLRDAQILSDAADREKGNSKAMKTSPHHVSDVNPEHKHRHEKLKKKEKHKKKGSQHKKRHSSSSSEDEKRSRRGNHGDRSIRSCTSSTSSHKVYEGDETSVKTSSRKDPVIVQPLEQTAAENDALAEMEDFLAMLKEKKKQASVQKS